MSYSLYAVCHDCREYIDLYKFWNWWVDKTDGYVSGESDPEEIEKCTHDMRWINSSLKLHWFMQNHRGHRVGVYDEHECIAGEGVELGDPMFAFLETGNFYEEYQEIGCKDKMPRPKIEYRKKRKVEYPSKEQRERVEAFFRKRKEGTQR